jgi:hypothetical protein
MSFRIFVKTVTVLLLLAACSTTPSKPWTADIPSAGKGSLADAGINDQRGRFREIYCEVLESRGEEWPDYRSCEEALTRVSGEPQGTGKTVELGDSQQGFLVLIVPGVGWECMEGWLDSQNPVLAVLKSHGFEAELLPVDGISSSANNARQIRDFISALPAEKADRPIIMIGYSKGGPDILEAVVAYPELHERVAAVVIAGGAVGGSPLADDAEPKDLNMMTHFPDADCSEGDGGGLDSLLPATRKAWLASNTLPPQIAFYSVVTYPHPDRMSSALGNSYKKLSKIDPRNDSQVIYYDQLVPDSTLLGFVNADHWAVAVPMARTHSFIGSTFVNKNDYPREALFDAILRFVEEDLAGRQSMN